MNRMDPANRFSPEAVRKHDGGDKSQAEDQAGRLNDTARQVAAQYRRDTMSPIMVSGVLRFVELALLVISGGIDLSAGTALSLAATVLAWGLREDVAFRIVHGDNNAKQALKLALAAYVKEVVISV